VTYNDTWRKYNAAVEVLEEIPPSYEEAVATAKRMDRLPVGVMYSVEKPVFHEGLYEDWNPIVDRPSRVDRIERISRLLGLE
jgi:hypothetical protein